MYNQCGVFMRHIIAAFAFVIFSLPAIAAENNETSITIYSKANPGAISPELYRPTNNNYNQYNHIPGYALVRETRDIDLKDKKSKVNFSDVAALIDPTTVMFKSITDTKGTFALEQNYLFDLVNSQKLLERYIGEKIEIDQVAGDKLQTYKGKLLSASGGIILQDDSGKVSTINGYSNVRFPELPGGLITKPTLVWDVVTGTPGKHKVETSYQTEGITWWADYNATFTEGKDANSGFLDLGAWVSIINKSGASYNDAKLKLVAGEVNRAEPTGRVYKAQIMESMAAEEPLVAGFAEKSFFEFHLYTLGRPATIPDNSTKQLELFKKASKIPAEKILVYYGNAQYRFFNYVNNDRNYGIEGNKKVDVYLKFKNSEENGVGMPLPAGRLRVSKLDSEDNSLEFIGEDTIDHTPKNEDVLIKMGSAFDVVGERKQLDFQINNGEKWMDETFEVTIRNHKKEDVKVMVKENMFRTANWKILDENMKHEKDDADTIYYTLDVPKDGEKKIRYKVRYSWQ